MRLILIRELYYFGCVNMRDAIPCVKSKIYRNHSCSMLFLEQVGKLSLLPVVMLPNLGNLPVTSDLLITSKL